MEVREFHERNITNTVVLISFTNDQCEIAYGETNCDMTDEVT